MATKILTEQEVLERIEEILKEPINKDLEFLGFVGGSWIGYKKTKIIVKCKKHNVTKEIWFSNFSKHRKYRCPECIKDDLSKRRKFTDKECLDNLNNKYTNYTFKVVGYRNRDHDIEVTCKKHGLVGIMRYRSLMDSEANCLCKKCINEDYEATALANIQKSLDRINSRDDRDISFLGFINGRYEGNTTRLVLRCNIHNITWDTTSYNNFNKETFAGGCDICKAETTTAIHKFSPEEAYKLAIEANKDSALDFYSDTNNL